MPRPNPDKMTFLEHLEELRQRLGEAPSPSWWASRHAGTSARRFFHFMTQPMRAAGFKDSFIYTSPAEA